MVGKFLKERKLREGENNQHFSPLAALVHSPLSCHNDA